MPAFSTQAFASALSECLPDACNGKLCVAFSGGLDSTVLLRVLADLRPEHPAWQVRAVHVDHQLQQASVQWAEHCRKFAETLGVALLVERVVVARDDREGLEAAARKVRYAALRHQLAEGESLLTAHHCDDQAETLILALMRGSGVQGLASMPARKRFGRGWHVRPLLSFAREELAMWASENKFLGLDDPTNASRQHDRNYLRHEVLPTLKLRWPALSKSLLRSTQHLGEALDVLNEVASADLSACAVDSCLRIEELLNLSAPRRRNLLRYWLRMQGFVLPSTQKLSGLERDLSRANPERIPCVRWQGVEVRWYRGLLYADIDREEFDRKNIAVWEHRSPFELPARLGSLTLAPTQEIGLAVARLPERLTVRFRSGHERIRLPGRTHRHTLRNLLQESSVLPWWRDRLPLIYDDTRLLAVGDLALSAEHLATPGEAAMRVVWDGAPKWRAVIRDS